MIWQCSGNYNAKLYVLRHPLPPHKKKIKIFTTFNNKSTDKVPCGSGRCFKLFQGKINFPVSVQSSLGGPGLRALFVRILSKPWAIPKLQPGSGLEGSSPSTWAGRNRTYRNLLCLGLMFIKCTDPYGSKLLWLSLQIVWCGLVQIFQMRETTMESTFFGPVVQLTPLLPCPREEKPRSPSVLPGKVPWGNSELQSAGFEPPPVDGLRKILQRKIHQNSVQWLIHLVQITILRKSLEILQRLLKIHVKIDMKIIMKINIDQGWSTMISKIRSKPKCLTSVRQGWAEHFTFWFIHARTAGKWRRCHAPDFAIHACQATREATHG